MHACGVGEYSFYLFFPFGPYLQHCAFFGFKVFFRLIGFSVIDIFPLWKKAVNEERNDYERFRFRTTDVLAESVGPGALSGYAGQLTDGPIKPGSVRFTDGSVVIRDEVTVNPETIDDLRGLGNLIGPGGVTGTVRYATGAFTLTFPGV